MCIFASIFQYIPYSCMEKTEELIASGYCYLKFEKDSVKVLCLSSRGFFIGNWKNSNIDDHIFINWSSDLTHTANMISSLNRPVTMEIIAEFEKGLWDICPIKKMRNILDKKTHIYLG